MIRELTPLLFTALAAGCVPDLEDEDLAIVTEARVLGTRTEPAEAKPGDTVRVTALVSEPGQISDLDWALCNERKPLTELGPVSPVCVQLTEHPNLISLGEGESVELTIPRDACRSFGPIRPEPEPGEPSGRPVDPDSTGGFHQPFRVVLDGQVTLGSVRLDCDLASATPAQAVEYRRQYRPNTAPRLDRLALDDGEREHRVDDGARLTVPPSAAVKLKASWAACPRESTCGDGVCGAAEDVKTCSEDCETPQGCSGAESYVWFNPESRRVEPRVEGVRVSWFASAGTFSSASTGRSESESDREDTETTWTAPRESGEVTVWTVTRDDRGGASFESFVILVE